MKIVLKIFGVLVMSMLLITSCENDDPKPNPDNNKGVELDKTELNLVEGEIAVVIIQNSGTFTVSVNNNKAKAVLDGNKIEIRAIESGTAKVTVTNSENNKKSFINVMIVAANVIEHTDDITSDETWSNKSIHLVTNFIAIKNATLTIEAGTVVKFKKEAGLSFGEYETQMSKLIAKGTADKRIVFTSEKATPTKGDWNGILFGEYANAESIMEYCDISFAGGYNESSVDYGGGNIILKDASVLFNYNKVHSSSSNGIYCFDEGRFGSFEGNEVGYNCEGNAIYIYAKNVHTLGVEKGERSKIENSSLHGIYVNTYNGMHEKGTFTWQNLGSRYTLDRGGASGLSVGSAQKTTLVLEAGVTLAFLDDSELNIGDKENKTGCLIAKGTKGNEIKFIAENIGNSGSNWDHIYFGEYNSEESVMEYCIVENAGGYDDDRAAAVRLYGSTAISFNNNIIKNSKYYGMCLQNDARFKSFTGNTITNSAESSIRMPMQWAHTIGTGNQIDNDGFGIALIGKFSHKNKEVHWLKQTCPYTLVYGNSGMTFLSGSKEGCTLIIDAGNRIQFADEVLWEIGDENKTFTLIAKGTKEEPIVFAPATETGTWGGIQFTKGTGQNTILENCEFIRGGADYGEDWGTLVMDVSLDNTPTIRNSVIKKSRSAGIYIYNYDENGKPVIENVTYQDCLGADVKYVLNDGWML